MSKFYCSDHRQWMEGEPYLLEGSSTGAHNLHLCLQHYRMRRIIRPLYENTVLTHNFKDRIPYMAETQIQLMDWDDYWKWLKQSRKEVVSLTPQWRLPRKGAKVKRTVTRLY